MAKKAAPKSVEASETAAGKGMTKADAARAALKEGIQSPKAAVAYILSTFGITMTPTHFSAVKSLLTGKGGSSSAAPSPSGKKRGRKPGSKNILKTPGIPASGEADLLKAIEAMKPLVASLGIDKVKRIADLLG